MKKKHTPNTPSSTRTKKTDMHAAHHPPTHTSRRQLRTAFCLSLGSYGDSYPIFRSHSYIPGTWYDMGFAHLVLLLVPVLQNIRSSVLGTN